MCHPASVALLAKDTDYLSSSVRRTWPAAVPRPFLNSCLREPGSGPKLLSLSLGSAWAITTTWHLAAENGFTAARLRTEDAMLAPTERDDTCRMNFDEYFARLVSASR